MAEGKRVTAGDLELAHGKGAERQVPRVKSAPLMGSKRGPEHPRSSRFCAA
jgi:hypothetical protein